MGLTMNYRRDAARAWLTTIAFALACGSTNASPAIEHRRPVAVAPDTIIPAGPVGAAVRRGRALFAATRDSLPAHVGNSLRCFSCHLDEGRRENGLLLVGAFVRFPQYRARRARVDLLEDRINDCFVRSMNGRAIPVEGSDMRDIVAYLAWLSRGIGSGDSLRGVGLPPMPDLGADSARGAVVFRASCTLCHGTAGEGTVVAPPLWGAKSFNIGAGMARYRTLASFIQHNMPFDRPNTLTPQQALDVARYIATRPRPALAGTEHDWPNGDGPSDVPYPTTARGHAHNGAR
jgi:thiosulfate dehydrogenase